MCLEEAEEFLVQVLAAVEELVDRRDVKVEDEVLFLIGFVCVCV
jgi:hypothetical protein